MNKDPTLEFLRPAGLAAPEQPAVHEVELVGHLDLAGLQGALSPIHEALARKPGSFRMLINALHMESYDPVARDWWVREWSPQYRPRLERLAIVTDRTVWHMLAVTLALATSLKIKPFREPGEAREWLRRGD